MLKSNSIPMLLVGLHSVTCDSSYPEHLGNSVSNTDTTLRARLRKSRLLSPPQHLFTYFLFSHGAFWIASSGFGPKAITLRAQFISINLRPHVFAATCTSKHLPSLICTCLKNCGPLDCFTKSTELHFSQYGQAGSHFACLVRPLCRVPQCRPLYLG